MFLEIAPLLKTGKTEIFHYRIPKNLRWKLRLGSFVSVPLGKRKVSGVVVGRTRKAPSFKLKVVLAKLDLPRLLPFQIKLAFFLADYYLTSLGKCLKLMKPPVLKKIPKVKRSISSSKKIKKLPFLTLSQKKALDSILSSKPSLLPQGFLLHDLSGEARLALYPHLIKKSLDQKKQVLFLTPEVNSMENLVKKFSSYFPSKIILIHSHLGIGAKQIIWRKIYQGKPFLVVGTRAALFYPYKNLDLIIVDEEENQGYKESQKPSYKASDLALKLGEFSKATTILASFLPSLDSYFKAKNGELKLIAVRRKATFLRPEIKIVDMRKRGKGNLISGYLKKEIKIVLDKGKKTLLFCPRRGFGLIFCLDCQYLLKCQKCGGNLVLHKSKDKSHLICQVCQQKSSPPKICPRCQGHKLILLGAGIQNVEEEIKKFLPKERKAKILTIDKEKIKSKKDYFKIRKVIKRGNFDLICGTSILFSAFPQIKVQLGAIIDADFITNLPDFRSEETLLRQILKMTQIVQRKAGQVIVQTFNPKNPFLSFLSKYDYNSFSQEEIKNRSSLHYPPFSKIIKITYLGKNKEKCLSELENLKSQISKIPGLAKRSGAGKDQVSLLGPSPSFFPQKGGKYCFMLVLKLGLMTESSSLVQLLKSLKKGFIVDVDPLVLL